jgi:hypothetical protein
MNRKIMHTEEYFNSREVVLRAAKKIRESGLKEPASLLFESHLPAFTVIYSIFLCTEPFILPFISSTFPQVLHSLYQNPEMREAFISELRGETV